MARQSDRLEGAASSPVLAASQATIRILKRVAEATGHSLAVDFRPLQKKAGRPRISGYLRIPLVDKRESATGEQGAFRSRASVVVKGVTPRGAELLS
jgi:hypothetical protein